MKKVGKIYFYASGWTANSAVDISYDGSKYKIHLGLFGEDSKYEKSPKELEKHLAKHFSKDEKFYIQKVDIDLSGYTEEKSKQQAADVAEKEKKRSQEEAVEQEKKLKEEKEKKILDSADDAIARDKAAKREKMMNVTGTFLQKALKIYLIALLSFSKNILFFFGASLKNGLSSGNAHDKVMNKYFLAVIKDGFIVFLPIVLGSMIYMGTASVLSSTVKQVKRTASEIEQTINKEEIEARKREVEYWASHHIAEHNIEHWKSLGYDTPEKVSNAGLEQINPITIKTFQKNYTNGDFDEAIHLGKLFKSRGDYSEMLAFFKNDETKLINFVETTGINTIKTYGLFSSAGISDENEMKNWNDFFKNQMPLIYPYKKHSLALNVFKTVEAFKTFLEDKTYNLITQANIFDVLTGINNVKSLDQEKLKKWIELINNYSLDVYATNTIDNLMFQRKITLEDVELMLSKKFNYIFDNNKVWTDKYSPQTIINEYLRKFGKDEILIQLKEGKSAESVYQYVKTNWRT
jgi:hypothetical protein